MRALAACLLLVGVGSLLAACGRDERAAPAAPAHATVTTADAAAAAIPTEPGARTDPAAALAPSAPDPVAERDCVGVWNGERSGGRIGLSGVRYDRVQVAVYAGGEAGSEFRDWVCEYLFYSVAAGRTASFFAIFSGDELEWPHSEDLPGGLSAAGPHVPGAADRAVDEGGDIAGGAVHVPPGRPDASLPVGTYVDPAGRPIPMPPPQVDCVEIWNAHVGDASEPWPYPRVQVAVYVATQGYGCSYRFYDGRHFAAWSALLTPGGPVWPPDQGRGARLSPGALAAFERWRDGIVDARGAIHGTGALVPREPSTLPVGTHLPPDRAGDPGDPAFMGTYELPVPVWRSPPTRDGMLELIAGRVHLDRATGCVTMGGRPALWPTGTWVTERPFVVHLPGRVVAREGDRIEGGGGEEPPDWARQLAEPSVEGRSDTLDCLDAGGTVAALNAVGEIRVTGRAR